MGFTPASRSMRSRGVDALSACVRSFKTVPQRCANDRVVVEPRSVSVQPSSASAANLNVA